MSRRRRSKGVFQKSPEDNVDAAIPYHIVYISSFENDLNEEQQQLIKQLALNANGAKAGVYFFNIFNSENNAEAFLSNDTHSPAVFEQSKADGRSYIEIIDPQGLTTHTKGKHQAFEVKPDNESAEAIAKLCSFCKSHLGAVRRRPIVFQPLSDEGAWKLSAEDGLHAKIGKFSNQTMYFKLGGGGLAHNALVGGAVGTGKTILLHSIILDLLQNYSPAELNLSLLDYKDGTEFSVYDKVPHLYALSLGSNTKFGYDLLQHFQEELSKRAELFKEAGVSNFSDYRKKTSKRLHRHLIVIDEFQVLLSDPKIGANSQVALEDLIRRGRSFGINCILSSQSLKDGALTPATKSNIGCRICLRLSENDCADFLSVENALPSKFTEPGQAVYNEQEGRPVGNTEFRVAYYSETQVEGTIAALLSLAKSTDTLPEITPYIYRSDRLLKISEIPEQYFSQNDILIGVEEGVPAKPYAINFKENKDPVIICGKGALNKTLEALIKHWDKQNSIDIVWLAGEDLAAFTRGVYDGIEFPDPQKIYFLRITPKDVNETLGSVLLSIITSGTIKLIISIEAHKLMSDLFLDKDGAECLICIDQPSYTRYAYKDAIVGKNNIAAYFEPGIDEATFIRIPE